MKNEEENNPTDNINQDEPIVRQSQSERQINPPEKSFQSQDAVNDGISLIKQKKKKSFLIIIVTVLVLIGCAIGACFVLQQSRNLETKDARVEAINQAKLYKTEGACTDALVSATHTATGAKYTFSNGCLAPGWVADVSSVKTEKETAMSEWLRFDEPTIGLGFSYPSEWGEAKLRVVNNIPDEMNKSFYVVNFNSRLSVDFTIYSKDKQDRYSTFYGIKKGIADFPESSYVLINTDTILVGLSPDKGNGNAIISAARLIDISKINAEDIILSDYKKFDISCRVESYKECYTKEEMSIFQWVLESIEVHS